MCAFSQLEFAVQNLTPNSGQLLAFKHREKGFCDLLKKPRELRTNKCGFVCWSICSACLIVGMLHFRSARNKPKSERVCAVYVFAAFKHRQHVKSCSSVLFRSTRSIGRQVRSCQRNCNAVPRPTACPLNAIRRVQCTTFPREYKFNLKSKLYLRSLKHIKPS